MFRGVNQPEPAYIDLEPEAITFPPVTLVRYMRSKRCGLKLPLYDQERFVSYLDSSDWDSVERLHELIKGTSEPKSIADKDGQPEWARVAYKKDNINGITLTEEAWPLTEYLNSSECNSPQT